VLAAFFSTHTLDHLLSEYGYAAVFAFVMVESLGVPFPGETMVITAALYAGFTHNLVVWLVWAAAAAGASCSSAASSRSCAPTLRSSPAPTG
jgi:membrane protein DedA with SNARE-associated domain